MFDVYIVFIPSYMKDMLRVLDLRYIWLFTDFVGVISLMMAFSLQLYSFLCL